MFRNLTPIVRALLYVNLIVYVVQRFTGDGLRSDFLLSNFALWPIDSARLGGPAFQPWQVITYAFLHDPSSVLHILSNMFALYMFGPDVELVLGSRRFVVYYFVCVAGGALTQLFVLHSIYPSPYPTLGASGAIFGVLLFFGVTFPRRRLMLIFPPIPMPAWLFVTLYGLIELWLGVFGTSQGVAHFVHLGGMAAGAAMLLFWRGRTAPR